MKKHSFLILFICLACIQFTLGQAKQAENPFMGMWTIDIEHGGVGWLHVHDTEGFLDAELMWIGGSVLPVSFAYMADEHTLVLTRSQALPAIKDANGKDRVRAKGFTMRVKKIGNAITGDMVGPIWGGPGEEVRAFVGHKLPPVGPAPDLSKLKYGPSIQLFNGKNLTGWSIIDPNHKNGFYVENGELRNNPVQDKEGEYQHYGNLRTAEEFDDFNISLEVNVPKGDNSGVYLKGMYEIQVNDSYGKERDSHYMGALYSRITPSVSAEKPGGEWQTLDITLYQRHVTVILNGQKIIDNQPVHGPTGGAIISDVFAKGPIYLQGDHGNVAYRNIVIKSIL